MGGHSHSPAGAEGAINAERIDAGWNLTGEAQK